MEKYEKVSGVISQVSAFGTAYVTLDKNEDTVPYAQFPMENLSVSRWSWLTSLFQDAAGVRIEGLIERGSQVRLPSPVGDIERDSRCPLLLQPALKPA
jgi:hypothetical protein